MAGVRFEDLSKTFPARGGDDPVEVIRQLNLTINDGEFLVLVGPSGCGKSTLLRLLAGLDSPTSGEIRIGSRPISDVPPARRNVAMVFQSYALYPHLSVRDNLSFGLRRSQARSTVQRIQDQAFRATRALPKPLRVRSVREERIEARVNTVARSLELTELLDRRPKELSGGQKQRVALGRAMARNPEVFLMDEPLSNLDAKLRTSTRQRIVELQRELGTTTVYVTHDQVEAMTMGDRIAVLNQGRLQQLGTPMELYRWPSNIFVAQFIGSPAMSLLPVTVGPNATLILGNKRIQVEGAMVEPLLQREGQHLTAGLRPEHWHLAPATNRNLQAELSHCERLGNEQILTCRLLDGDQLIQVRASTEINITAGDAIHLDPDPTGWRLFDADGEAIR
ncbi:ABC transporter ATP-binding protein [Synechococcus sp. TAK9802]|uniref:ABC transporter ATP-binding protein n=1 Tax=Synechococcus sp. TAK9802 TaxID=1442558 RepID=UPI001645BB69|nr:ABC transporter ATP-binding protein [Synechococcus sp. TAK9802]QNI60845.1 ABC transporter family protein [Synechococcus sp. TAK9802]